ncbi:MAG TPA: GMC family oxidoreductase [Ktedonobacterales bacterium]|nr:GMC family oxidoreductase [Ktedonobacterales bacterium]
MTTPHTSGDAVMASPLAGGFDGATPGAHMLGPIQTLDTPMRRYGPHDEVDYVIVGVGSAGGVLIQRLARAGFRVVGFDAGPFWDTERDWVSDEAGSYNLYWNDLRITGGSEPLAFGANNSGKGVGGGSVHWAGFTPRFHPSDFSVYSDTGLGADWPISYQDVKPYYELLELEIPVAGPSYYPWGDPHGYAYGPHPMGGVGDVLINGCTKLGIGVSIGGPVAITSGSHGDRPHCIYRGFCIQGCKVGAKQSTLISHVPDAIRHGAEIRANCMVARVNLGADGRVTGVTYFDPDGNLREQHAKVVIVSGYSIETPRLLFNSACPGFEQGLANSSGVLGKYLMAQAGTVVLGRFAAPIRMYKAPPAHALTEEFYETDPARDFVRGFAIQTVGPLPIAFAKQMMVAKGAWGWGMRKVMMDYNHWAALGFLGEILPWEDNRVELAAETDRHGLPVAKITFGLHDNDKKLIKWGVDKTMEVMYAAGAEEVVREPRYAHLIGGARMGNDPRTSVVDGFGRAHDIPNLFLCDGSIFPTQGSANPGLTIQAIAARTSDYLIAEGAGVVNRPPRAVPAANPPLRRDLSPHSTAGRGMPRLKSKTPKAKLGLGGLAAGNRG